MQHPFWSACVLLLFFIPVLLLFASFGLAGQTFQLLGLSSNGASLLLGASLIGGVVNIPLTRRRIVLAEPDASPLPAALQWLAPIVHYYPPRVTEQVVALNVGGALVPLVFSAHLITQSSTSVPATLGAVLVVTVTARLFAHPVPGVGVTLPPIVSPLAAALAARGFIHAMGDPIAGAAPVAYIAGTVGTLIGADVLNLPVILRGGLLPARGDGVVPGRLVSSIGGAGIFDGIFLTSILAPFLATL